MKRFALIALVTILLMTFLNTGAALTGDASQEGDVNHQDLLMMIDSIVLGLPSTSFEHADTSGDQIIDTADLADAVNIILRAGNPARPDPAPVANPLRVLGWDIKKACPGIPYEYRLGVQGGQYPYQFRLLTAPEGMQVDPALGTLTWLPQAASGQVAVAVDIADQGGQRITHSFAVDVSADAFRFVAADGDDSNPGTAEAPWATIEHAVKTADNSQFIYVREGSYPVHVYIENQDCGKLLAYPGDEVSLVGKGTDTGSIWLRGEGEYILQGFHCDANKSRWFLCADTPSLTGLTVRKNHMFNVADEGLENPAFLFFWDGEQKPIQGEKHYSDILVQENSFHGLRNSNHHGASATLYNVQDMVFEDNLVYDIDGNGVTDKDDGFRNTYRNNLVYGCTRGLVLANQNTQGNISVHHNLIHDCETALVLGWQPGYLKDVVVHHNTLLGSLELGQVLSDNPEVSNINCYGNIIGDGKGVPYQVIPVADGDTYTYPSYVRNPLDDTLRSDRNLLYAGSGQEIAGYEWGLAPMSLKDWQAAGYDRNSTVGVPDLDANKALAPDSPYYGRYGRDNPFVQLPDRWARVRAE